MKPVIVMARPLGGGAPIIGSASDVCVELWGRVPSNYPRHIVAALRAAREGIEYKGYTWGVLPALPKVIARLPYQRSDNVAY